MPVKKPHLEFHAVDMTIGWATPPGYPAGIEQKILAGTLDEVQQSGSRSLLLGIAVFAAVERLPMHFHLSEAHHDGNLIAAVQARPTHAVLDLPALITSFTTWTRR